MPRSAKKRKKSDSSSSADVHKTPIRRTSGLNSGNSTPSPLVTGFNKTPDSAMHRIPSFGFGLKSPSENQFISPSQMDMHRDVVWQDTTAEECRKRLKAKNSGIYGQEEEQTPPLRRFNGPTTPKRRPKKNHSNAQLMEKLQIMSKRIALQKEEEARIKSQADNEDNLFDDSLFADDWEEDPDIDFFADTVEDEVSRENGEKQTEKEDSDSDIFNDDFIDDAVLQCTQELEKKCDNPSSKTTDDSLRTLCNTEEQQSVNERSTRYDVNRQWQSRARENLRSNIEQAKVTEQTTQWGNSKNGKQSYPVSKRETPSRNCKNTVTSYQHTSRSSTGAQVKKLNTSSTRVNAVPVQQPPKPLKTINNSRNCAGIQTRQQTINKQASSFSALGQGSRAKTVPPPPEPDSDDEEFMSSLISTLEQVDRDLS